MKVNQIRAGAILSYLSMGLGIVISLVYTPVMVDCLGSSEYAVYNLVLPIISYLSLMSLGLGSAYVRYYSRYKVAGDKKNMAKLNGMFLVTYSVLGTALLALGFLLSLKGEWIFGSKLTAEEIQLGCRLLRIMSVNAALCLPISVFESHVAIQERYLFQKILAMGKQVLNPLLMIPLLLLGYRSVTLTVVALGFTVVSGLVNVYYCLVKLEMPFRFGRYDFRLMREMMGFTVYVFIGIVVNNFNWAIDRLLLGWIHGTDAVTIYVPAAQLNTYFLSIATIISGVLIPRVNRIVAEKRPMRELDALFTKTGRLQFIILSCVLWGFVAVGRPFVVLWMGAPEFSADYTITLILMFACVWSNCQTLGIEIQTAMNMHRFRSLVYAAVAVGNTLISIPLCMRWEGVGSAIGTMIATIVGEVFLMNWYYCKRIGLNIPAFWKHLFHLLPAMLLPAAAALLIAVFAKIDSYWGCLLWGLVFVAVYAGSMWLFGLNRFERGLVSGVARKLFGKRERRT